MPRLRFLCLALSTFGLHALTAGCNVILGNEDGYLESEEPTESEEPQPTNPDAAIPEVPNDAEDSCPVGKKGCFSACVDRTDTNFGCGTASCDPCGAAHTEALVCLPPPGGQVLACAPTCVAGWADCNGEPSDGCETDLTTESHCGSCDVACGGDAPFCSVSTTGASCVATCDAGQTQCGNQCVDVTTNANHCGACDDPCEQKPNSTARCGGSKCSWECDTGHHECGGTCVPDSSLTQCSRNCIDCVATAPLNMKATACNHNGGCVWECAPNFRSCDGIALNGCEARVGVDVCGPACAPCSVPDAGSDGGGGDAGSDGGGSDAGNEAGSDGGPEAGSDGGGHDSGNDDAGPTDAGLDGPAIDEGGAVADAQSL